MDYLESMRVVTVDSWRDLEKELVLEGTFKKGGFMDIREEIREKGRLEGWQKGQQEGWQKGQQEGRQEVALNLLSAGLDLKTVSNYTGFSEEEIKKLKNGA